LAVFNFNTEVAHGSDPVNALLSEIAALSEGRPLSETTTDKSLANISQTESFTLSRWRSGHSRTAKHKVYDASDLFRSLQITSMEIRVAPM
jgi:hypothetical protein